MANLASVILEGANLMSSSIDTSDYDYSDLVVAESSYIDSAVATLFTDIMEAEQNFMVADVVGAATIIHESKLGSEIDAVAVTEGVIKSGIEKIKNAFKKFFAKIKEYYNKIINWFKAMFSNAENFVKNYGDDLRKKAAKTKGFTYTGYNYQLKAGDSEVDRITGKIDEKIKGAIDNFDFVKESTTSAELYERLKAKKVISSDFDEEKQMSVQDEVDKFLEETTKASDSTELRNDLIEIYHDKDDNKIEIKDFEANSIDSMLSYLKTSKKTIDTFNKELSKYEEKVKKIVGKLDSIKDDGENADKLLANVSRISSLITAYLNLYKVPCDVRISIHKAVSTEWLSVLKKFYNYKPTKESTEIFDEYAYATLESSLVLESDDVEEEDDDEGGCKKKKGCATEEGCATKEGCTESAIASILEQASRFSL